MALEASLHSWRIDEGDGVAKAAGAAAMRFRPHSRSTCGGRFTGKDCLDPGAVDDSVVTVGAANSSIPVLLMSNL